MHFTARLLLSACLSLGFGFAGSVRATTEVYTNRVMFDARILALQAAGIDLPVEFESFEQDIPGDVPGTETGPPRFTYAPSGITVSVPPGPLAPFGVFGTTSAAPAASRPTERSRSATRRTSSRGPPAPLRSTAAAHRAPRTRQRPRPGHHRLRKRGGAGFCPPFTYHLLVTGADLSDVVVDSESSAGNGASQNLQFLGIIDPDTPFTEVTLLNTGFFDASQCSLVIEPDRGDTVDLDDAVFAAAVLPERCGDVDGDRILGAGDPVDLRSFLAALDSLVAPNNCSVRGGPFDCDVVDLVVLRRELEGGALPPGVQDVCASLDPNPPTLAAGLVAYWTSPVSARSRHTRSRTERGSR
jgi:hypothetical protein